jgi:hypothetical protein
MVLNIRKMNHSLLVGSVAGCGANQMHFDERKIGDFRIFVGALEAPKGQGYTATMVVERIQCAKGVTREILREDNIACGHRWESPSDALKYALKKAQEAIRDRCSPMMVC